MNHRKKSVLTIGVLVLLAGLVVMLVLRSRERTTPESMLRERIQGLFHRIEFSRSQEDQQLALEQSLTLIVEKPEARSIYVEVLNDPKVSDRIRMHCIIMLSKTGDRTFFPHVSAFLNHSEEAYRILALKTLKLFRDRSVVPRVVEMTKGLKIEDWIYAARLLQELGSGEAIPIYIDYMDDLLKKNFGSDSAQVQAVVHDLFSMTGQRMDPDPRVWRLWWSDHKNEDRVALLLAQIAKEPALEDRLDLVRSLGAIGTESILAPMVELVRQGAVPTFQSHGAVAGTDYTCLTGMRVQFSATAVAAVRAITDVEGKPAGVDILFDLIEQFSPPDRLLVEALQSRVNYPFEVKWATLEKSREEQERLWKNLQDMKAWWFQNRSQLHWDHVRRQFTRVEAGIFDPKR